MNFLNESRTRKKVTISIWDKLLVCLLWILFIIPGVICLNKTNKVKRYLKDINKQIINDKTTIDGYLDQRIEVLKELCQKDDKLAKRSFSEISNIVDMSTKAQEIENISVEIINTLNGSKGKIEMLLKQDSNIKKQIVSFKDTYNNKIVEWNKLIFKSTAYKIVAAKENYFTELYFTPNYLESIKITNPLK